MDETTPISPLRRWLESILVWYFLFMMIYLLDRFVLRTGWRFTDLVTNGAPYLFVPVLLGLLLAILLRARRLSGLYLLLMLLGLLWVGPPLLPRQGSPATPDSLELVTFNIYPDNPRIDEAVTWFLNDAPDIIALQQIPDDNTALSRLDEGYPYRALQDDGAGNIVYSRYPILQQETVDLGDWGVQRLELDISGMTVILYNVQIVRPLNDRHADWIMLRYDETRRNEQIMRLLDVLATETQPLIVAGDFNLSEWSPVYRTIANQLEDAYRASSWGIGATYPAGASDLVGAGYPRLFRLDYVWYSPPITAVSALVGPSLGSDHLPLSVELQLP